MKLNVLLARAEHTGKQFAALIQGYIAEFKNKQGLFEGEKKHYQPEANQEDEPKMHVNKEVQSTVGEKLKWFIETITEHLNNRMSVEATNAAGPKAELKVGEFSFGKLSTCELLRLQDILNDPHLHTMHELLPVRPDTITMKPSQDPDLKKRKIHETEETTVLYRTTIKGSRILEDPNAMHLKAGMNYVPVKVDDDKTIILGKQQVRYYSGAISHLQRAETLRKITLLRAQLKEALTVANEAPVVKSEFTAEKFFAYLYGDIIV